jgi:hypothetical protein
MDFEHFRTLALETLQRDLAAPGFPLELTIREYQGTWVVDVVAPGRGAVREIVPPSVGRVAAVASISRLIQQIREMA